MSKVRVFYKPDGTITIRRLALKASWLPNETEEERYERLMSKNPKSPEYDDIEENQVPKKDMNRDKWRGAKGQGIWVDETVKLPQEERAERKAEIDEILDKTTATTQELKKVLEYMREGT